MSKHSISFLDWTKCPLRPTVGKLQIKFFVLLQICGNLQDCFAALGSLRFPLKTR